MQRFEVNRYALMAQSQAKVIVVDIIARGTIIEGEETRDASIYSVRRLDDQDKPVGSPFRVEASGLLPVPFTLKNYPKTLEECSERGKNNVWIAATILTAPHDGKVQVRLGDGQVIRMPAELACGWTHEDNPVARD